MRAESESTIRVLRLVSASLLPQAPRAQSSCQPFNPGHPLRLVTAERWSPDAADLSWEQPYRTVGMRLGRKLDSTVGVACWQCCGAQKRLLELSSPGLPKACPQLFRTTFSKASRPLPTAGLLRGAWGHHPGLGDCPEPLIQKKRCQ